MKEASTVGIVSGSGLSLEGILDEINEETPFAEFECLSPTTVFGHEGRFIRGKCGHIPVVIQSGRLHVYEGCSPEMAGRTIDVLRDLGAASVLFTNAAGGLLREMQPGQLMSATDVYLWPYAAWSDRPESLDFDVQIPGCDHTGTYAWVHGPCYETRAEIRAMEALGLAAVGMSTAPELYRCKQLGIRTAAISCITNNCFAPGPLSHDDVLATAAKNSQRLREVVRSSLPLLV